MKVEQPDRRGRRQRAQPARQPVSRRHDHSDPPEWETVRDDLAELQQPGRTDRYALRFDEALGKPIERHFEDGRGHIDEVAFSVSPRGLQTPGLKM